MRPWIEKLAKISKEEGIMCHYKCTIPSVNISWAISITNYDKEYDTYIQIDNPITCATCKIYEDEHDLLKDTLDYVKNRSKDIIIEQINNL